MIEFRVSAINGLIGIFPRLLHVKISVENATVASSIKMDGAESFKVSQRLINAAIKLLPDECKGEIDLLQAVHSKLDSKGEL